MPLINLIAEERLEARIREQRVRTALTASFGLGAVLLLTAGFFAFEAGRHELISMGLERERQRLKPMIEDLEETEGQIAQLEPRVQTLQQATLGTEKWTRILGHLTTNTPEGLWFTSLKCSQPQADKATTVQFQGMSLNQDRVGDLIVRLQTSPDLDAIALNFTSQRAGNQAKAIEFEVGATVFGTQPKPKRDKTDGSEEGKA